MSMQRFMFNLFVAALLSSSVEGAGNVKGFTTCLTESNPPAKFLYLRDSVLHKDAFSKCKQSDAVLASVTSDTEFNAIKALFNVNSTDPGTILANNQRDFWIGVEDVNNVGGALNTTRFNFNDEAFAGQEGFFRVPAGTGPWKTGQPDDFDGSQNCVVWQIDEQKWNDIDCAAPETHDILCRQDCSSELTNAPVQSPTAAPVQGSTGAPVQSSTGAPVQSPTAAPVQGSTAAPVQSSTAAPVQSQTGAPSPNPTTAPDDSSGRVLTPTTSPTKAGEVNNDPSNTPLGGDKKVIIIVAIALLTFFCLAFILVGVFVTRRKAKRRRESSIFDKVTTSPKPHILVVDMDDIESPQQESIMDSPAPNKSVLAADKRTFNYPPNINAFTGVDTLSQQYTLDSAEF